MKSDFFGIGETLIDLISVEVTDSLANAQSFHRFAGGQVTNLAVNMVHMGYSSALATCVGPDGFGKYLKRYLDKTGVNANNVQVTPLEPTSLSFITRNLQTPDFSIFRGADAELRMTAEIQSLAAACRVFHTSAFGLSKDPARSTILQAMRIAYENKALITLDPNFHPHIFPDVADFKQILNEVFQYVNVTKPSLDDCARIFGADISVDDCIQRFLAMGVDTVIVTMGVDGARLATSAGDDYRIFPKRIDVSDVTGARDAYWAGFLSAWLAGASILDAARAGQVLAEIKIGVVGPMQHYPDRVEMISRTSNVRYELVTNP